MAVQPAGTLMVVFYGVVAKRRQGLLVALFKRCGVCWVDLDQADCTGTAATGRRLCEQQSATLALQQGQACVSRGVVGQSRMVVHPCGISSTRQNTWVARDSWRIPSEAPGSSGLTLSGLTSRHIISFGYVSVFPTIHWLGASLKFHFRQPPMYLIC